MPTTNSSIQFKHGLQETFSNITKDSNTIYFITDTNRLFVGDSEYTRPVQHGSELPTSKNPANSLFVKETGTSRELYYSKNGTAWDMITYLPATITGGVFGNNTSGTVAYGGTVKVPKVTVDNRGYVTAAEDVTLTLPASDKVTTVTTSGDGNAVTGGSISADGATLTLTKGTSFMPTAGGTFSGDVVVNGDLTTESITPINNNTIEIQTVADDNNHHECYARLHFKDTKQIGNPWLEPYIEGRYCFDDLIGRRWTEITLDADNIILDGPVSCRSDPSEDNHLTNKLYVDDAIDSAFYDLYDLYESALSVSDAMVFKGTVGRSGTAASFSAIDVSSSAKGDTYKVITADTLPAASSFDSTAHDLTPGDLIVYMGESKFIYVPSGDEDVTSVKVAGSGDTINVSTTAQTGTVVLGDVATKKVSTSTTLNGNGASNNNVATELAVKTYVDDTVGALENTLGTAATTNATDYATAAQGTKADNAMPKSGGTFTGAITLAGAPTTDLNAATKKYVDDTVSGVTDTKVTTVTTAGDGNAVTGGSISADGTTLTLTKGQEFVPAYGITATQESYSDGPHSGMTENTLNLLNLITMRQGRENNYTSSIDPSINFTISPTVPDISTTGTPSASIVVNKGYVDNGRFIYKGTIGTNGDFSSIDDALDYVEHGSHVCAVKGSLYLITSNMTLEQSKACIMNNGYVLNASNDISLHAGDFIVVVQSTENYTYQSGNYVEHGYYYLSSVSNVKFIVIPASSTHVSSIKIAGSDDTINVSTSSQKANLFLARLQALIQHQLLQMMLQQCRQQVL